MDPSKILEIWLSECMIRITSEPISSLAPDSPEWNSGYYISGAQAYAAYKGSTTYADKYANLCFEGLREWLSKHADAMPPEEQPELTAVIKGYPINWLSVDDRDTSTVQQVWNWYDAEHRANFNWYRLDGNSSLSPYDVLSIPMSTFMDAVHHNRAMNIAVWNTDGLTVVVQPRSADRYHPGLQLLLD